MGLYDYFEPDPSIECPNCGGSLSGWEGKDGQPALLVWRQGVVGPIEQRIDPEFRTDLEALASARVPAEFRIYGGECKCGYRFDDSPYQMRCTARDGVWQTVEIVPAPMDALDVGDGLIRCSECCDVWARVPGRVLYHCPTCARLARLVPPVA